MEQENQQLKMANLKQTEQIMLLQDKLQGGRSGRAKSDGSAPIVSVHPFDLFGLPSLALVRSTSGESLRLWISRHLS